MSMFYCNSCDMLVDSDAVLFVYEEKTDHWTCYNCLEANTNIDEEKAIELFNENPFRGFSMDRATFHGDDIDYGNPYSHRYDEPDSDRGASDEGY